MNNMKRTVAFVLVMVLITNLMLMISHTSIKAEQKNEDLQIETTTEQSGETLQQETTTVPISETSITETTTVPISETTVTEPLTETTTDKNSETTAKKPNKETTTNKADNKKPEKVKPWGKNSAGKFVNGKGKVIKGATMKGIDVSHHNGKINWKKVAASDIDFAIIRCGYGSDYKKQDDKYWEYNVKQCEKYGIPYGVYLYSYATNVKQAKSEAKHVLRLIKGHKFSFPIYYDMEDNIQLNLSMSMREKIAKTFLKEMKKQGYECGVYANLNWWNNYIPSDVSKNPVWYKWVAQYNDKKCTYTGAYEMWQCTSQGKVKGIEGDVDINFWFGEVRDASYCSWTKPISPPKQVKWKTLIRGNKKVVLKWKKVSKVKGYKIQYSTSKKFNKNTKNKYTKNTNITIDKLKSNKKYYFRIKAYKLNSRGKKVYSKEWSAVRVKKTK